MSLEEFRRKLKLEAIRETNAKLINVLNFQPYYGIWINYGDLDNNYVFETNRRKCKLISQVRGFCDDEELRNLKAIYFPNFFDPKNFIKLIETPLTCNRARYDSVGDWLRYINDSTVITRFGVIESIIENLPNDYYCDAIKEAISKVDFYAEDIESEILND